MYVNTLGDLASMVRGRRRDLNLSQAALATRAQVSREWVNGFETGKTTVELELVFRVLNALDLKLEVEVRDASPRTRTIDLDQLLATYGEQ